MGKAQLSIESDVADVIGSALQNERASLLKFDTVAIRYICTEAALIFLVTLSVSYFYLGSDYVLAQPAAVTLLPSLFIALCVLSITFAGERFSLAKTNEGAFLWAGIDATLGSFAFLIALLFAFKLSENYSRSVVIGQFGATFVVILCARFWFVSFVREQSEADRLEICRFVVIGRSARQKSFLNRLTRRGANLVSALDEEHIRGKEPIAFSKEVLGLCRKESVDHVIIALSDEFDEVARRVVEALMEAPVTIHVSPEWVDEFAVRRHSPGVFGLPMAIVAGQPLTNLEVVLKRSFDIVFAFSAVVILSPVFLAVALAIRLESKGPVLFRQTRHGYGNAAISVFKFRSMSVIEDGAAFRQATKDDPRITRVGRFIRATNLDELPQFLNVLLGEMSIVGPRPHPVALNESFEERIRWFNRRHIIRPGITGWAQIHGYRGETETLAKMVGRVEHDLWYVDNWSFLLDLKIVMLTIFSPLAYRGAR